MPAQIPAPASPPRLLFCLLILAVSLIAALAFAKAFETIPAFVGDPTVCGEPVEPGEAEHDAHASHGKKAKPAPVYYTGGLWSQQQGLGAKLDLAMLAAAAGGPIACESAVAAGESLLIIDRSPITHHAADSGAKPILLLSVEYAGGNTSYEFPAAGALQEYITGQKDRYESILIIEPIPGPTPDPDDDWTYLDADPAVKPTDFFTPKRNAKPIDVLHALYKQRSGTALPTSTAIEQLIQQLDTGDASEAALARWQLIDNSPYLVVPALNQWIEAAPGETREKRVYEAIMIRRAMGIHADELIAEAVASKNPIMRALAARAIGDLHEVTTNPIGKLTPLAEDDEQSVRYEALVATRAMPGPVAAGVAQLVEPYEMSDSMRALYRGTMEQMLAFGEPLPADSRANRLRRMTIGDLLSENRGTLVCMILLERTDLPDDKIDEVLKQLAEANGQGPLVALLNLLEAMNPRTLTSREVLLEKLVAWKTNELNAQTPRLKEMALGNGSANLRSAAAAAMIMSSEPNEVFAELGTSPIPYQGLDWIKDAGVLTRWAEPIAARITAQTDTPAETTIAAIDAVKRLPEAAVSDAMVDGLLKIARGSVGVDLRFAAIRAVNALPESKQPDKIDDLTLTTMTISAVKGQLAYDKTTLTVPAGRPVELTLLNPDSMEHNLVITKPGTGQSVGAEGSQLSAATQHVPESDDVLHYTPLVKPGASYTLRFVAPTKPGQYDYVCSFPGHPASMKGILEVTAP